MAGVEIIVPTGRGQTCWKKENTKEDSDEQIRQELHELEVKIKRIRNSSAFKSKQVGKWKQLNFDGKINDKLNGTNMDATKNDDTMRDDTMRDYTMGCYKDRTITRVAVCTYDREVVSMMVSPSPVEGTEAGGRLNNIAPND